MKNNCRFEEEACFIKVVTEGRTYEVVIDKEDFEKVDASKIEIKLEYNRNTGELISATPFIDEVLLKDIVLKAPEGYEVYYLSQMKSNKLDCRKSNFRLFPITKEALARELRTLDFFGVNLSSNALRYDKELKTLYVSAKTLFEGKNVWKQALEYAGVTHRQTFKSKFSSKEDILKWIQGLEDKSSSYAFHKENKLYAVALDLFGSWGSAVEEAGFSYDEIRRDFKTSQWFGKNVFEPFVSEVLQELGFTFSEQDRELAKGIIPDFVFRNEAGAVGIFDAKLSQHTHWNSDTQEKYSPHCDQLTFVYLRGKRTFQKLEKNVFNISIFFFIKKVKDKEKKEELLQRAEAYLKELEEMEETAQTQEVGA